MPLPKSDTVVCLPWKRLCGGPLALMLSLPLQGVAQVQPSPLPAQPPSTNLVTKAETDRMEQVQMDVANGFFSRDFYELAISEYRKYLEWFPEGYAVEEAQYRLAECYRGMGREDLAQAQYQKVQKLFPQGTYWARAAFRLGEFHWNSRRFGEALPLFKASADRAESAGTRLTARFHQARCLHELRKFEEAVPVFHELAREEKSNPYRGFAFFELGKLLETSGKPEEAMVFYGKIVSGKVESSDVLKSEATLKMATLAMQLKQWKEAVSLYEKLITLKVPEEWMVHARHQLVRAHYQLSNHEEVIRLVTQHRKSFSPGILEEVDLMRAHAYRLLKNPTKAAEAYGQFLKDYPSSGIRENIAYERLVCLFTSKGEAWVPEADAFVKEYPKSPKKSLVLYLCADLSFRKEQLPVALKYYQGINLHDMEPDRQAEILYKLAYCLMKEGQFKKAAGAWGDFVKGFPSHEFVPSALYQMGISCEKSGQKEPALTAFLELAKKFPKAADRENAVYRAALLRGELGQFGLMRNSFQEMNRDYPGNTHQADAKYWVGWSYFEEKNYLEAIPFLIEARKSNPQLYGGEVSSRLILSYYYLKQRESLIPEMETWPAESKPFSPEIYDWTARESIKARDLKNAEIYFRKLLSLAEGGPWKKATRWDLAGVLSRQDKWPEAIAMWEEDLKGQEDPSLVIALHLKLARGYTVTKAFEKAREQAETVLQLQPEGRNNAEARFLLGELMEAKGNPREAGKFFLSVAVLYEDPEWTPRSLSRAIRSFQSAGETNQVLTLQKELKTKFPNYKVKD